MYILKWMGLIIIAMLLGCLTGEIFFLGVVVAAFGFLFVSCIRHGAALSKTGVVVMAVYCFIWGSLLLAEPLVDYYLDIGGNYSLYVVAMGIGLIFLLLGSYMGIIKKFMCSRRVEAQFIGAATYKLKGIRHYTPRFSFRYNGKCYSNTTGEMYSERRLEKKFRKGKSYTIYVNPKNPNTICMKKLPSWSSVLLMFLGILFIMVPFS